MQIELQSLFLGMALMGALLSFVQSLYYSGTAFFITTVFILVKNAPL